MISPRHRLQENAEAARAQVGDLTAELQEIFDSPGALDDEHDAEGSTIGFERARVSALLEAARASLDHLAGALARFDSGHYGCCESCGGQIGSERQAVLPATTICFTCAKREP